MLLAGVVVLPAEVAVPPAEVAKVESGPAAAVSKKRCKPPATVTCVACWHLSRGGAAGKAHADTCRRSRPRGQKRLRAEQKGVSGGT